MEGHLKVSGAELMRTSTFVEAKAGDIVYFPMGVMVCPIYRVATGGLWTYPLFHERCVDATPDLVKRGLDKLWKTISESPDISEDHYQSYVPFWKDFEVMLLKEK